MDPVPVNREQMSLLSRAIASTYIAMDDLREALDEVEHFGIRDREDFQLIEKVLQIAPAWRVRLYPAPDFFVDFMLLCHSLRRFRNVTWIH